MASPVLDTTIIFLVVSYIVVVTLISKEFYRIAANPQRAKKHFWVALGIALFSFIRSFVNAEIRLSDLYLLSPLLFLILLKTGEDWMQKKYGRPLIVAHKGNMAAAETKDAVFWDYAFFFIINFTPIIMPFFVYETLWGKV